MTSLNGLVNGDLWMLDLNFGGYWGKLRHDGFMFELSSQIFRYDGMFADFNSDLHVNGFADFNQDIHVSNSVFSNSFIKNNGLSTEFLKADGTVDSNSYLTNSSASSNFVNLTTNQTIDGLKTFSSDVLINGKRIGAGVSGDNSNTVLGSNLGTGTGLRNTALGSNAMGSYTGTSFDNNTGVGYNNMIGLSSGYGNTSLGAETMFAIAEGSNNTAIGNQTLMNAQNANNNTAIGANSGNNVTTGSHNTFIGNNANVANDNGQINNATAIGYGANVSSDNTIQLGNSNITAVKTSGALTTGDITYPTLTGTSGQVLTSNGSGSANWENSVSISQLNELQAQIAQLQAQIASLNFANGFFPKVTIGSQIWSSTNLDVTTYRDGTPIPQVTDPTEWSNLTTGAWCYVNNDSNNNNPYGKLYNWYALNDSRGIAPAGYHVATENDFNILINTTGGDSVSGWALKEQGSTHWSQNYAEGSTNSTGFTAVGSGLRLSNGDFIQFNRLAIYHLSDIIGTAGDYYPHYKVIRADDGFVFMDWIGFSPKNGFSVRLVKD
jgi:uncharacterized protein (TIGR02145 family)